MELKDCPDCRAKPGNIHMNGCDVERCSLCGGQLLSCSCERKEELHDNSFSRWTGFWPGYLESSSLGIDLNEFYILGYHKIFFIKP